MERMIGKTVAWMTKEYGAVMGTVIDDSRFPNIPRCFAIRAESSERNCKRFDKSGKGRWLVLADHCQLV